jgi:hypothetical protein
VSLHVTLSLPHRPVTLRCRYAPARTASPSGQMQDGAVPTNLLPKPERHPEDTGCSGRQVRRRLIRPGILGIPAAFLLTEKLRFCGLANDKQRSRTAQHPKPLKISRIVQKNSSNAKHAFMFHYRYFCFEYWLKLVSSVPSNMQLSGTIGGLLGPSGVFRGLLRSGSVCFRGLLGTIGVFWGLLGAAARLKKNLVQKSRSEPLYVGALPRTPEYRCPPGGRRGVRASSFLTNARLS